MKNTPTGTSRTDDKFVMRLPDGMRDKIAELARNNKRSMNTEFIIRLQESIEEEAAEKWTPVLGMLVTHNETGNIAVIRNLQVVDNKIVIIDGDATVALDEVRPFKQCVTNKG
jgi:hypothetical protein